MNCPTKYEKHNVFNQTPGNSVMNWNNPVQRVKCLEEIKPIISGSLIIELFEVKKAATYVVLPPWVTNRTHVSPVYSISHLFLQIFAKARNLIGFQGLIIGSPFWKYPVAAFGLSLQTPFLRDIHVTFEEAGPLKSVHSAANAQVSSRSSEQQISWKL